MTLTKLSEITSAQMAEFLRLPDPTVDDYNTLNSFMNIAIAYIEQYTGRTEAELDDLQDVMIAALILVQDMWDNRTMYVDRTNVNKVVDSILNLHQVNLL